VPIAATLGFLLDQKDHDAIAMGKMSVLAALATWRMTKGLYRFHEALLAELWESPVTGKIPPQVLMTLPEWCCYVETPGKKFFDENLYGFFVHLEEDANTKRMELRYVLDLDAGLSPCFVEIGDETLDEALERSLGECLEKAKSVGALPMQVDMLGAVRAEGQKILRPLTSLTLYLCAKTAEIRDLQGGSRKPGNPTMQKIGKTLKLPAAQSSTVWECGWRVGPQLAKSRFEEGEASSSQTGRKSPRPHVRRAHWTHVWLGSGPNKRCELKWIHALLIGSGEGVATVRPVGT
jgi:hypothetical protein